MSVFSNVLELIGHTPIVRINHLDTGPCELFIKLESQNPGGSIKDRIGLKMIEDAEAAGKISPGSTLVEGTAGNTGLGLALVAAQKGYRLMLVIPDKMSREKISNLKAMGAEVVLTRSDVAKGHPEYYQDLAKRLAAEMDNAFFINQFSNPSNPKAHEETTGPEIWEQMDGDLDAIVLGVGSRRLTWNWCWPIPKVRSWRSTSTGEPSLPRAVAGWWKALARIFCPPSVISRASVKRIGSATRKASRLAGNC